ncbi:uncharacterized mitochondrial protein AtMg00810-like [Mangifera indica]|uniref:uncharacterized mitochondrial protein AtMg00810-like n=1 Tax=Mangifera indica TaxID=29780 RepID=UPI001CFB31B1|nr:uncharacterized mitochondrial protein AtMg00810-like [Mangifera indica]
MKSEFDMSDLGEMKYFLRHEIEQNDHGIFLSQKKYALDLLKKFNLDNYKSVFTPHVVNEKLVNNDEEDKVDASVYRSLAGSLLYLSSTRPDIMFIASILSRFMFSPNISYFCTAKRVLRYIKGNANCGLWYSKNQSGSLVAYSDNDWAGSVEDSKSTSGYCFSFGNATVFSWNSKKQDVVA